MKERKRERGCGRGGEEGGEGWEERSKRMR
jgi:hypothetical protein